MSLGANRKEAAVRDACLLYQSIPQEVSYKLAIRALYMIRKIAQRRFSSLEQKASYITFILNVDWAIT